MHEVFVTGEVGDCAREPVPYHKGTGYPGSRNIKQGTLCGYEDGLRRRQGRGGWSQRIDRRTARSPGEHENGKELPHNQLPAGNRPMLTPANRAGNWTLGDAYSHDYSV